MKTIILTFSLLLIFCSCGLSDQRSTKQKLAHGVFNEVSEEFSQKFQMQMYSITEGSPENKYALLGMSFTKIGPVPKSEGRRLLLECTRLFLEKINSNKELTPYLAIHPFTEKNVKITIMMTKADRRSVYKPDISFFTMNKGDIYYKYSDPDDEFKLEYEKESYEEALRIVEGEGSGE